MIIRRAEINDCIGLSELNKQCLPIYYTPIEFFMMALSLQYIVFVVEYEGKIVGYMVGEFHLNDKNYHILSIGVDKLHRSKGIGEKVISELINLVKSQIDNITLYVHVENEKAVKFYEKEGFMIVETIKNYYQGSLKANSQDAHRMKKILV